MKIDREFAGRLLELAIKKGADLAEVYVKSYRSLLIEVKDQTVEAMESSISFGYSVRVIRDSRLGFSYSTDPEELAVVVDNALQASRWTERDTYLELPEPSEAKTVEIYDSEIDSIGEEDAREKALLIERSALREDSRIKKIRKASGSFSRGEILILNSEGVDENYSSTTSIAQIMTVAEDGSESQMGWDFEGSRFLKDVSFENVGRNAARRAIQLLGARKISAIKAPVILDNSVTSDFLGIFVSSLSSESVQKGKSLLAGKIGQEVISSRINIIDDGLLPRKLGSRPIDDEGVATREKILIKEGVLLGYLYNIYTAKKDGVASTGNAVRRGFSDVPLVGALNLYIDAASRSDVMGMKEMVSAADKGLFVTEAMGVHTANPISGEFSVGVSGLWIENGEIKFPVKEAVISGNILDFFGKVEAVGDDLRFYGNIGAPSLLIGPTDISA